MIQIGTQTDTYLEQHPVGSVYYEGDKRYYTAEDGNVYELEHFEYVDKGEVFVDQDYADSLTSEQQDTGGVDEDKLDELVQGDERLTEDKGIDLSMPEGGLKYDLDTEIDPAIAGMLGGRGQALRKGASWLGNKIFASPALKANQLAKGGKVSQRIEPGTISKNVAGTGLKPSVKKAVVDKYNTMAGNVAKKRAGEAATVAGAGTAMYLAGDTPDDGEIVTGHPPVNNPYEEPKTQSRDLTGSRDANGNLMTVDADRERYAKEGKVIFTHANGSYAFAEPGSDMADELMAQEYFAGDIAAQNAGKSQSNTGSDWSKAKGEVKKEEPKGEDVTKEERPGWHKREGANFWTVNNDSPHWQTDEGAEEAKEMYGEYPAWVKQPKVQEVDWSGWFNFN